jgi:hypothetical protein
VFHTAVTDEAQAGVALEPPHRNGSALGGGGGDGHGHDGAGGGDGAGEDGAHRSRLLRVSLLVALVVLIGLWAYALVYSVVRRDPERLSSAERTEVVQACKDATKRMLALPVVPNPPTNATVAARATAETDALERMVTKVRTIHPDRSAAATALTAWLHDWDRLLDARRTYADEVRTDRGAQIVVPNDAGSPIFVRMNKYADGKGLAECRTDQLGAERVNEVRKG